jgi:DNA topoisomerase-1
MGRYGPMVQIGDTANEEEKPRFAKLKQSQSIETISHGRSHAVVFIATHTG